MKRVFILVFPLCLLISATAQKQEILKENSASKTDSLGIEEFILKTKVIAEKDTATKGAFLRAALARAVKAGDYYNVGKVYYEIGELYFQSKNHNRSLRAFINAKEYFVKTNAFKEIAKTNFAIGRQQYYRGNYKLAGGNLTYAMRLSKQMALKDVEANVLEYLGILYHVMPSPTYQSTTLLQKSLLIKSELGNYKEVLRIHEKLAGIYYDQQKFDSASYHGDAAVKLAYKLTLDYDANLSRLNQVSTLLRLGRLNEAKSQLSFIKKHVLDSTDLNLFIRYHIQAGNYQLALRDKIAAQQNYNTALYAAQVAGFPEMYALVYKNMASAYYYNHDFKNAFQYQLQYTNKMTGLYSEDNFTTFKELEYILKTNATEDEVKYLNIQNQLKETRLRSERNLRLILLAGVAALLLCAALIFFLYKRQKIINSIIQKKDADMQVLVQEMHHRVKNNLQIVSSLLDLQSVTTGDKHTAAAIRESRNRVHTMALIHQDLYHRTHMQGLEMKAYIHRLVQNLFLSYNVKQEKIQLRTNIGSISLNVDHAILIGLTLNELISNALKYAFDENECGLISITLQQERDGGELLLEVKDNGHGFQKGWDLEQPTSIGYKLVKAFAQRLKAKLEALNDDGACIRLYIGKLKYHS